MKKFLTSSVVAATFLAGTGFAAVADKVSTSSTGEFLIAPQYYAVDGFKTELKLVNTSAEYAYYYRAVVREYASSEEFDFIVMLSPLDVWTATLEKGSDGDTYFVTDDDSNYEELIGGKKNITQFTGGRHGAKDRTFEKGYVEFFPIAAVKTGSSLDSHTKLTKDKMKLGFQKLMGIADGTPTAVTGFGSAKLVQLDGDGFNADYSATDYLPPMVAGFTTITSDSFKAAMKISMLGLNGVNKLTNVTTDIAAATKVDAIKPGQETDAKTYLGEDGIIAVNGFLSTQGVTLPYSKYGVNDAAYFTFWNDHAGKDQEPGSSRSQTRTYKFLISDFEENSKGNAFSGSSNSIKNEMSALQVYPLLKRSGLLDQEKYENGVVRLYDIKNDETTTSQMGDGTGGIANKIKKNPPAIVTYMSATHVNGQPSYSWTYAPVHQGKLK